MVGRSGPGRLEPGASEVLRAAVEAGDKTVDVYLDLVRGGVVRVKDGVCDPDDLDPEQVEEDEARFAEIPVVTEIDEHLWMEDFVEARDEPRVAALLDARQGANARFLKRLAKQAPEALAAWEAFRAARIDALVADWLAELGAGAPPA